MQHDIAGVRQPVETTVAEVGTLDNEASQAREGFVEIARAVEGASADPGSIAAASQRVRLRPAPVRSPALNYRSRLPIHLLTTTARADDTRPEDAMITPVTIDPDAPGARAA